MEQEPGIIFTRVLGAVVLEEKDNILETKLADIHFSIITNVKR